MTYSKILEDINLKKKKSMSEFLDIKCDCYNYLGIKLQSLYIIKLTLSQDYGI